MELHSLDKLGKKKFWTEFFRRGMCLLLAIIMVLPAGGGVFAAGEGSVGEALLKEATDAIKLAHKLEIDKVNSAIWWTKDILVTKVSEPLNDREKAVFLTALLNNLGFTSDLIEEQNPSAYKVKVTVLGVEYTINATAGTSDPKMPKDQIEEFENRINRDKNTMVSYKTKLESSLTEEGLKEIVDKTIVINDNAKRYVVELNDWILKEIGQGKEFDDIDIKIKNLKDIVDEVADDAFDKALTYKTVGGVALAEKIAGILVHRDRTELELAIQEVINYIKQEGLQKQVNDMVSKINESNGTLARLNGAITNLKKDDANLKDISNRITVCKDEIQNFEDILKDIKAIGSAENPEIVIEDEHVNYAIALLKDKLDEADKLYNLHEAILAVKKAEASKTVTDISRADVLVEALSDSTSIVVGGIHTKETLRSRMEPLNEIVDNDRANKALAEAIKAVTLAETQLNKYADGKLDIGLLNTSIKDAVDKIGVAASLNANPMELELLEIRVGEEKTPSTNSTGLYGKRNKIEAVLDSIINLENHILVKEDIGGLNEVIEKNAGKYTNAQIVALETALIAGKTLIGKSLNTRIADIYKVLEAIPIVNVELKTLADIKAARSIVSKLNKKFDSTKAILNAYITEEEDKIKSNEPKTSLEAIEKTYNAVVGTTATSAEIAALIKSAKTLIGKEPDNIKKIKMNAVISTIDTAQKSKEAVDLAEATKLRKDLDKADALVKQVPDKVILEIGSPYPEYKFRTDIEDGLANLLETRLNILKPIVGQMENEKAARDAVAKVEKSLIRKDYEAAIIALEKPFIDSNLKTVLKDKLDVVLQVIDATDSVIKAEKMILDYLDQKKGIKESDMQGAINSANNSIGLIEQGVDDGNAIYKENKVNLQNRINKVSDSKTAIDKVITAEKDLEIYLNNPTDENKEKLYKEGNPDTGSIVDAKKLITPTLEAKVRTVLEKRIEDIWKAIDSNVSIQDAEDKVKAVEKKINDLLLESGYKTETGTEPDVKVEYHPIKDRTGFTEIIATITKDITEADNAVKTIKDKRATELKNRLAAVTAAKEVAILIAKAEGSNPLVKSEVDAASKALPKVKEDIINDDDGVIINHKAIKAYFEARVKYLNAELVKVQQFTEAKKLTDKAYETLSEGDIKKAIEYVAKIQDEENKSKFNEGATSPRIYGIDTILKKFAAEKVEKNITDAISGLQMDLKSGSKPVSDAKKATDVFSNLVKLADSRLGKNSLEPPIIPIEYAVDYADEILEYNTNNTALAKAQQVWQQIAKADKSKSISDIDRLYIEFELLIDIVEGIGAKFKDKYYKEYNEGVYTGGLLGTLYGEITRIKNFQTGEDAKKAETDEAILAVIATLRAYTEATSAEEKKTAREKLPTDIGEVRKAVAKIDSSDKAAHKEYNAKITLMELYRDAINKINRAQISCTPANVKDAKAAVDKCDKAKDNGDYIFVNVVLVREIDELYERLVNEESAEKAKILVDKAWETKTQIDFDIAKNAVTRLPENNEAQIKIKNDLLKSLEELKEIIDKLEETDRKAVAEAEKALKEALKLIYESKIQNIDPDEDEINEAYAKLTGRGIDGTSNEDPEFAEYYIKTAKDYANSIVRDLDGKNALLEIIAEREHLLKVYSEEILIKEARRLIVKADASVIKRNSMPKDTEEERRAWEAQTVIANGDLDSAAIAIKRINLPENLDARQRLLERLGIITKDLNTGTTTDKIAYINGLLREATKRVADARDVFEKGDVDGKLIGLLTDAKNLVGDIEIEIEMLVVNNESEQSAKDKLKELVAALRQNVTNIENGISDKDLIANAEKAIKAAEDRVKKKEYESAKIDVMEAEMNTEQISDTNAIKRNELRSKINKLKNEIAQATGGEETPPLDDQNDPKIVAKALQLYYKAKASLLQKDIDAARKYINENMVHNTTLKQWLLAKLAELEKIRVGINKPGDIEDEKRKEEEKKRKEEEAKRKAEEARKKKYPGIDEAINADERDTGNSDPKWGDTKGLKKK